jgi:AcrR family transcriptional regulator
MPRAAKDTKRQIMDAAYDRFYKEGFARTSVDAIAAAAGVTKRTFYYHFDSKDSLLSAVLTIQHELMLSRIQGWAQRAAGKPAGLVKALFREFAAWAEQPQWRGSGFTRAAMEFAHSPGHPARSAARRHKAAVESWLAEQFARNQIETAQDLARQVMLLLEGCNALILIHGDKGYADAASEAARMLVERHSVRCPRKPVHRRASR